MSCWVSRLKSRFIARGMAGAPSAPCRMRAPIKVVMVGASAQSSEASVKPIRLRR
jgi:hypothetical protein